MTLEIYWSTQSASRPYELDFWPDFVEGVEEVFERRNLHGILLGWPRTSNDKGLQPDALIVTQNAIVIVDFKNDGSRSEQIQLPHEFKWTDARWGVGKPGALPTRSVSSGSNKNQNPFMQVFNQVTRLKKQLEVIGVTQKVSSMVLFQKSPKIAGEIPEKYHGVFKIATSEDFHRHLDALLNINSYANSIDVNRVRGLFQVVRYQPVELPEKVDPVQFRAVQEQIAELAKTKSLPKKVVTRTASVDEKLKAQEIRALERTEKAKSNNQLEASRERERTRRARYWLLAFVTLAAIIVAFALTQSNPKIAIPNSSSCVQVSEVASLEGKTVCVTFVPAAVGYSKNVAYLNDIADYKNGNFFVQITDVQSMFSSREELEAFVGMKLDVTGLIEKSSDGRLKIKITDLAQLHGSN